MVAPARYICGVPVYANQVSMAPHEPTACMALDALQVTFSDHMRMASSSTGISNLPAALHVLKQPKLPLPQSIHKSFLLENCDNRENIECQLNLILDHISIPGGAGSAFSFESGLMAFMDADEARRYVRTFFLDLTMSGGSFERDKFIAGFTSAFTGDVRPAHVVALHDLISGAITQGTDPVAKYVERFCQRSRQLPGESQASLCLYFISGLKPTLRAQCCLDRDNTRWVSLSALIQFSLAEEERFNMVSSLSPFPHLSSPKPPDVVLAPVAVVTPKRRAHREWNHNGKRKKRQTLSTQ